MLSPKYHCQLTILPNDLSVILVVEYKIVMLSGYASKSAWGASKTTTLAWPLVAPFPLASLKEVKVYKAKIREIPNGTILAKNALFFCIANILLFFIICYYINPLCFKLSPIAIIIILLR